MSPGNGRRHLLWRVGLSEVREGFSGEMILRLTKGTCGLNQVGMWQEGRGNNGIPDRYHAICVSLHPEGWRRSVALTVRLSAAVHAWCPGPGGFPLHWAGTGRKSCHAWVSACPAAAATAGESGQELRVGVSGSPNGIVHLSTMWREEGRFQKHQFF